MEPRRCAGDFDVEGRPVGVLNPRCPRMRRAITPGLSLWLSVVAFSNPPTPCRWRRLTPTHPARRPAGATSTHQSRAAESQCGGAGDRATGQRRRTHDGIRSSANGVRWRRTAQNCRRRVAHRDAPDRPLRWVRRTTSSSLRSARHPAGGNPRRSWRLTSGPRAGARRVALGGGGGVLRGGRARASTPCDHLGDVIRVSAHAVDHRRRHCVQEVQPHEIQPGLVPYDASIVAAAHRSRRTPGARSTRIRDEAGEPDDVRHVEHRDHPRAPVVLLSSRGPRDALHACRSQHVRGGANEWRRRVRHHFGRAPRPIGVSIVITRWNTTRSKSRVSSCAREAAESEWNSTHISARHHTSRGLRAGSRARSPPPSSRRRRSIRRPDRSCVRFRYSLECSWMIEGSRSVANSGSFGRWNVAIATTTCFASYRPPSVTTR